MPVGSFLVDLVVCLQIVQFLTSFTIIVLHFGNQNRVLNSDIVLVSPLCARLWTKDIALSLIFLGSTIEFEPLITISSIIEYLYYPVSWT